MNLEELERSSREEALAAFIREIGVAEVPANVVSVGNKDFLKFAIGRDCPLYEHALFAARQNLSDWNVYKGTLGVTASSSKAFPESIEARALQTLLSRSTREVAQGATLSGYRVPYVPFQQREDHTLAQPAAHIVRGRRGVGKSTLIRRAIDLLKETNSIVAVVDMQVYSTLSKDDILRELFYDVCLAIASASERFSDRDGLENISADLNRIAQELSTGQIKVSLAPVAVKRAVAALTKKAMGNVYLFLDDFHLIEQNSLY